jgi:hypothetical protein
LRQRVSKVHICFRVSYYIIPTTTITIPKFKPTQSQLKIAVSPLFSFYHLLLLVKNPFSSFSEVVHSFNNNKVKWDPQLGQTFTDMKKHFIIKQKSFFLHIIVYICCSQSLTYGIEGKFFQPIIMFLSFARLF